MKKSILLLAFAAGCANPNSPTVVAPEAPIAPVFVNSFTPNPPQTYELTRYVWDPNAYRQTVLIYNPASVELVYTFFVVGMNSGVQELFLPSVMRVSVPAGLTTTYQGQIPPLVCENAGVVVAGDYAEAIRNKTVDPIQLIVASRNVGKSRDNACS